MSNNPVPEKRPHPLEVTSEQRREAPRQQTTLHIPSVKPRVTYVILAINIAIFLLRAVSVEIDYELLLWGANNPHAVLELREYYRLLTSMFLHSGIYSPSGDYEFANSLHLVFNAVFIYQIGVYIEPLFGHWRFG